MEVVYRFDTCPKSIQEYLEGEGLNTDNWSYKELVDYYLLNTIMSNAQYDNVPLTLIEEITPCNTTK